MPKGTIQRAYLVPGLPHLVADKAVESWERLRQALRQAGERVRALRPEVLVLYSTQWISVLGHSFQANPNPKGLHVDENWYEMGDFPFDLRVDTVLGTRAAEIASSLGLATKTVNYQGFPLDTGTLVALRFLNPDNAIPVSIVSCNIYAGQEDSLTLGRALRQAIEESGKRAVVVACTALSARFFTEEIDPHADRISRAEDDVWNRRVLDLIAQGKNAEVLTISSEYAQAAGADMGFKAFAWLMGVLDTPTTQGHILAYGPIWGTGAAVVEYTLTT
ncbi:MAG TPA: 2-amino-5-chlorophenol 1,6-dioxygenase subunit alpha [Candidatus Binatia bacterium]|jgi:2-aminophenol/2-amino-5-chlorophenol 1,6-dioxygenase alpha subunit|nr:2-amino-5-chlorophenol 1,6-dioxygenase subunit alpha [Candidatus Binatia bacterium]